GGIVVLLTLQTLRHRETETHIQPMDTVGLALLVIGVGCLQIMPDRGRELDWFNSEEIIILTVIAVIALSMLLVWELTDDHPIVDLSLCKSRNFTLSCLAMSHQLAAGYIAQQITKQGLIISANEIFWASAGIFLLLLIVIWFARPPFGTGSDNGGAH
ncbi:hypothetical protein ACGVWS_16090, partial [Enterobacteriaceae bacterium LUAb1]